MKRGGAVTVQYLAKGRADHRRAMEMLEEMNQKKIQRVADHARKLGFAILGNRKRPIRADIPGEEVSFRFNTVPRGYILFEFLNPSPYPSLKLKSVKLTVEQFLKTSKIQVIEDLDLTKFGR